MAKGSEVAKKHRVQFDFSAEELQRLHNIKQKTGASTSVATVKNALRLYDWYLAEKEKGNRLALIKTDGETKEIEILF